MANVKEYSVEEKLASLVNLQKIESKLDEIHILKGELPMEVADLEVTQGIPQDTNADIDFGLVQEPPDIISHERDTARRPTGEPTTSRMMMTSLPCPTIR